MREKGEKVHTRTIEINTYVAGENKLIVEGILKDERFQETYVPTGEKFPPGIMHHMSIRLLVNGSDMKIEDVAVEFGHVPREYCRETEECLRPVKGMQITKGFTGRVKELVGGVKGCAHLVELLQAMAPASFQGVAAYRAKKPTVLDARLFKMVHDRLVNTCYVWREGGPLTTALQRKMSSLREE
ncbi:MAG: DUF2889 domain-containing protein [Syntrophales bacterium]|nr:DUF2889 domain-containing protein [Syntrophales bacterium]